MNTAATRSNNKTVGYIFINVLYFCVFCSVHGFAAVILLDRGFSNALVGITLALANILSAIGQPVLAAIVDKSRVVTNRRVIIVSSAVLIAAVIAMFFIRTNTAAVFILFAFVYALQFIYQSNVIAMNFEYQRAGCKINFGLARGLGSAGFAVSSAVLGGFVEKYGTDVLLYFTLAALFALIIAAFFFKKPEASGADNDSQAAAASTGLFALVKKYKRFMIFILGTAFCFFSHNMLNDYLIQIIRNLGGAESQLGYATFLAAILELPVMAFIGIILKKTRANKVLVFSATAFLIKNAVMLLASNMFGMYLSQACQLFAYAVFIPTAACYADEIMESGDKVKGQALINSAITLGGVFSNLICGKILDSAGVNAMLLTGLAVCLAGVMLVTAAVYQRRSVSAA